MTDSQLTYWAFLSLSQQDNCEQRQDTPGEGHLCWGDWLHHELETFSIPAVFAGQLNARGEVISERIDPIFQDREEQPANARLSEQVRLALDQSKCLIVICSPRSAKSLQVNEQVRYFKQLGRGNRILPLVIAGEPNASDGPKPGRTPEDECFVPALRHPVLPDGTLDSSRRDRNSIFADARLGEVRQEILAKDRQNGEIELETAKIQLIAGLIGVGFHGLWGHELKRRFAETHLLAREARPQNQENGIPDQAAQSQLLEAQRQTREALGQVVEARNQTRVAEAKVLEAQQLARAAQHQLAEARQQVPEVQNPVWEAQNLPPDVQGRLEQLQNQLQAAQDQAREAQNQAEAAHQQARELETKFLDFQNQLQAAQDQARNAQNQAAEARQQGHELENKVLESQHQAAQSQSQVREMEDQARQTQARLAEAHRQAGAAESRLLETQPQVREAQNQLAEAHRQARELEHKFLESQNQVRLAHSQIQETAAQARTAENETLAARRRTKVSALLAVLALMAAGTSVWQRQPATPALAGKNAPAATDPRLATNPLNRDQILQALQNVTNSRPDANQLRSLDELAIRIPAEEFSNTLGAASAILTDPQRSHFQELLLADWMKTNLPAAFDWTCQLTDTNSRQRALEKLIPALASDNPTNTLARLNDLKPAPDDQTFLLFFRHWAATDPVPAINQRRQIPSHDADDTILSAILTVWVDQQPAAALNWLESQPNSEALPAGTWRNSMIVTLFDAWAAKDLEAASTACQQLPEGLAKEKAWECILSRRIVTAPAAAAESVNNLAPGDYRQTAIAELCRHWADTDAPAALAWVPALPAEDERVAATNQVIARWAGKDPPAATQFASQHPELSGAVLGDIASAWSRRDLSATTNWIASLPDGEKKDAALLALASATTDRAPLLAAQLCTLLTTNQPAAELLHGIATALAGVDLASAVEWARGLKEEPARLAALSALAEPWAQHDPPGLATYALALPAGALQRQLLTAAGRQLARRDWPGLVRLLTPLSDGGLRQSILKEAGRDCDLLHLDQTAKAISTMPAGDDQQAALQGLLSPWTAADPEAAANWLVAFPATNAQPAQLQSVIKAWSQPEPAAVAKWLANLPLGTVSDEMIGAFLEGAVVKYPAYAAQWTQSATNQTNQQKFELQVARQWMKTAPLAAAHWVDHLNLPEAGQPSLKARLP